MHRTIPELKMLLSGVEKGFGRTLATSNDFEALSESIESRTGQMLSVSTLKRLWGYVTSNPVPRIATLDILALYIGKRNFKDFCRCITGNPDFQSSFFSTKTIVSGTLEVGVKLAVSWNPDRTVVLEYLGDSHFRVTGNENSHIQVGDEFDVSTFMVGYPLFLPSIVRNGELLPAYVAGSRDGITGIEIL